MHAETRITALVLVLALAFLVATPAMAQEDPPPEEPVPEAEAETAQDPEKDRPPDEDQSPEEEQPRRVKRLGDMASDEWELDLNAPSAPPGSATSASEFDLPDPEQNAKLQQLLSSLAARPNSRPALQQLDEFLSGVVAQAHELADQERLDEMHQLLRVVRNVNPRKQGLPEAFARYQDLQNIGNWLESASMALDQGQILEPPDESALHYLGRVLAVDPHNPRAAAGMQRAQGMLLDRALQAAQELDFDLAEEWLYEASLLSESQEQVERARSQVAQFREQQAARIEQDIGNAIESGNFDYADFILIDLVALLGNDERVSRLRDQLKAARVYGKYTPGQIIQDPFPEDQGFAPALSVVRAGSFLMGSADGEVGRQANEGPRHRVTLPRGFALGLQEVTVAQFREFVRMSRYRTTAEIDGQSRVYDERSGRITLRDRINWTHNYEGNRAQDDLPVVHVSWHDAKAYVKWLSEVTGKRYRLPTEAEFEYALRAGTVSLYWWGDAEPDLPVENLTGLEDRSASGRQWSAGFRRYGDGYWGPAPGARFPPNPLGLHDMAGNVSEWVEDCWHQTYVQAPTDGSAWVNPGCERRVLRGGYWASSPDQSRSAARLSAHSKLHGPQIGFRIARDL
jgi:formylglycine-generating enzyme required for sulfatase activity